MSYYRWLRFCVANFIVNIEIDHTLLQDKPHPILQAKSIPQKLYNSNLHWALILSLGPQLSYNDIVLPLISPRSQPLRLALLKGPEVEELPKKENKKTEVMCPWPMCCGDWECVYYGVYLCHLLTAPSETKPTDSLAEL